MRDSVKTTKKELIIFIKKAKTRMILPSKNEHKINNILTMESMALLACIKNKQRLCEGSRK